MKPIAEWDNAMLLGIERKSCTCKKNLMAAKLQSQTTFLKSLDRYDLNDVITGLSQNLAKVNTSTNTRYLLTAQARVGHLYFRTYVKLFPTRDGIYLRRGRGHLMNDRYASDVINLLSNFGYSVRAAEITKFASDPRLNPYYGFMQR